MYDNVWRVPDRPGHRGKGKENMSEYDRQAWQYYFDIIVNLALARVTYENLPKEIPPAMLEAKLLWRGAAIIFKDDVTNLYAVTDVTLQGNLDIYGVPVQRLAYAYNYINKPYYKDNSVIMWSRPLATPEINNIMYHCDSLTNMRTSRDMNIIQQRTPVIISGEQEAKLDQDNMIQKILRGIPFFRVNRNALKSNISIEAMDLHIPAIFDKMDNAMLREFMTCLAELGIEGAGVEKPERLVSSETSYNNGLIEAARNSVMEMRKRWCTQFNEMFGENVIPHWNSAMLTPVNAENYKDQYGDGEEGETGDLQV